MTSTTSLRQRVECDHCGLKVWLTKDGAYTEHGWKRHGVFTRCEKSSKRYAFHMGEFRIIQRDPNGKDVTWLAECRCGEGWTGPEYEDVEAQWSAHQAELKAAAS